MIMSTATGDPDNQHLMLDTTLVRAHQHETFRVRDDRSQHRLVDVPVRGSAWPPSLLELGSVADPSYVRLVPLPGKGQITMHPICGADISDSGVDRFGNYLDNINELFKQAKTIEDALPKKTAPPTAPAKQTTPATPAKK